MRIGMCPLRFCGWSHVTLLRPAITLADRTAITCFYNSGLSELVDLMKVAPGLKIESLCGGLFANPPRGPTNPHRVQLLLLGLRKGRPAFSSVNMCAAIPRDRSGHVFLHFGLHVLLIWLFKLCWINFPKHQFPSATPLLTNAWFNSVC
jgi:hypothetical protein